MTEAGSPLPSSSRGSEAPSHWRELDPRQRRRELARTGLAIAATWVLLLAGYSQMPLAGRTGRGWFARLVLGGLLVVAVLVWQVRSVTGAERPGLRAVQALGGVIPVFIVTFAGVYLSLSQVSSGSFSEPLNHSGALYLAITILSTVGFGDITPEGDLSRLVVSVQMLLDLVLIGVVVRLLTTAAKSGRGDPSSPSTEAGASRG